MKYEISLQKWRKVTNIILGIIMSIGFFIATIYSLPMYEDIISAIIMTLIFIVFIILGIIEIVFALRKKAIVSVGSKIIYCNGFFTKEYLFSELGCPKSTIETSIMTASTDPHPMSFESSDNVIVFYDKNNKKLFKFGDAYANVSRLVKDIENYRKK